jgi:hypothetical protein
MSSLQVSESTNELAARANMALIQGDLSKLTEQERLAYYHQVCHSVGLNPNTKPLGYLSFQGKLTLYATRNCTDQLRAIHGVSLVSHEIKEQNGVLFATVTMRDRNGRTDTDMGAIPVKNLQGDALANAWMKVLTKAKRRCTLSLCGLSTLDETETDTMPGATIVEPATVQVLEEKKVDPKAEKLVENAKARDKALAEFTALFNQAQGKGNLPDDWKTFVRNQYGVTTLKDASIVQLGHLIDWVSGYAHDDQSGEESQD